MGYLILLKFLDSDNWAMGKWFATHEEAQFWVHTLPLERVVYKIIKLKSDWVDEPIKTPSLTEDNDIPSEFITPQCNLDDEECESCQ